MRLQNPLLDIASDSDAAVLKQLAQTRVPMTARQISDLAPAVSLSSVRRSLDRLAASGLLTEEHLGSTRGFSFNREHLFADHVEAIVQASAELQRRIATMVSQWEIPIIGVALFGSAARGEMTPESDIDLVFFVLDEQHNDAIENRLDDLASQIHSWTGKTANPIVVTPDAPISEAFRQSLLNDSRVIYGDQGKVMGILGGMSGGSDG